MCSMKQLDQRNQQQDEAGGGEEETTNRSGRSRAAAIAGVFFRASVGKILRPEVLAQLAADIVAAPHKLCRGKLNIFIKKLDILLDATFFNYL